jgi:hypothetical protein
MISQNKAQTWQLIDMTLHNNKKSRQVGWKTQPGDEGHLNDHISCLCLITGLMLQVTEYNLAAPMARSYPVASRELLSP